MNLETVRECFLLFVNSLKSKNITFAVDEINNMTHTQIKQQCHLIYMQYLVSNTYSVSDTSIVVHAYRHMIEILDDFSKDYNMERKYDRLQDKYYELKEENKKLKESLISYRESVFNNNETYNAQSVNNTDKKKSWFNL